LYFGSITMAGCILLRPAPAAPFCFGRSPLMSQFGHRIDRDAVEIKQNGWATVN
jgi:hypothetical protein